MVMAYSYSQLPVFPMEYPQGPSLNQSDRLLVVAPHPDDEVICNGGIVRYAVENHIPVKVVVVSDGDDTKNSPLIRHNETINGTKILGLNEDNIIFLGYHDGSIRNLLNDNWNYNTPFTAPDGSTNSHYPYSYQQNATYCGNNLASNLETVINDFHPTIIVYPSGDDEQLDHQATSGFIEYVTIKTEYNGSKYTYLLHLPPNWPYQRSYYPDYYLTPPNELINVENGPKWYFFNINTINERLKEEAMYAYKTQITSSSYLLSFLRKNELYAVYPPLTVKIKSSANNSLNDYFNVSEVPPTLFYDAKGDGKYKGDPPSMDIVSVGIDLNNEGGFLSIKTEGPPVSSATYSIKLNIFKSSGTERIIIKAHHGSAQLIRDTSGNSSTEKIPLIVRNNSMVFKIPPSLFNNSSKFIISADTSLNSAIHDQTPWRVIKIT